MMSAEVQSGLAMLRAGYATLAGARIDALTHGELLEVLTDLETLNRRLPSPTHPMLARLAAEASPTELGAKKLRDVLTQRLRISRTEATRRLADATAVGPRTALTGQRMDPLLPATAAAHAAGTLGIDHVRVITAFFAKLPHWVDARTREQSEATLVEVGADLAPDDLTKAAERLAAMIDQDGPAPDDAERARKRGLWIGKQGTDGMTPVKGNLDPQALATWQAIAAKWAAPGMCNPDDQTPCVSGTPSQAQIDGDHRTLGQRNHDALTAIGRSVLASGELGQHNGLPVTIIVSTTLQDLQSAAGCAVTGGGALLPMSDVIRMASHAHHYLVVYDKHTQIPLHLFRNKRCASAGQRIVLHHRDRGCTFPNCTVPGYGTQVHHIISWTKDGQTNIDVEVLACGGHNRYAEQGWTVTITNGIVEWTPPPHLDTGQARTNTYHHPERMLSPPHDESG